FGNLIAGPETVSVISAGDAVEAAGVPEGEGILPVWQWITNGFQAPIVEAG
ncbi:MAG: hypothetical protein RLZZ461_1979, partial [Planctomycetota bacterium]